MSHARFIERETGLEVSVETVFSWQSELARVSIVSYPDVDGQPGRRYAIEQDALNRHFAIVTPQEIFFCAYGGHFDRPTPKQRERDAEDALAAQGIPVLAP